MSWITDGQELQEGTLPAQVSLPVPPLPFSTQKDKTNVCMYPRSHTKKEKRKRKTNTLTSERHFQELSSFGVRCAMTRLVYIWNWGEKGLSDHPIKVVPLQRPDALPLLSLLGSTHWEKAFDCINSKWGQLGFVH